MEAHEERVIAEKAELDGRIKRLSAFLLTETFAQLPIADRNLLGQQFAAMRDYAKALGQRIEGFSEVKIDCDIDSQETLVTEQFAGRLFLDFTFDGVEQAFVLTADTATKLRDRLTRFIDGAAS